MTIINQCDLKSKVPPKLIKETLPSGLKKWYSTIEKLLPQYLESKLNI